MKGIDGAGRISGLCAALARITASQDPGNVLREVVEGVHASLRRREGTGPFVLGELAIDYDRRLETIVGRLVELTATEYELLRTLSVNAGRVTTHDALLHRVRGRCATS